MYLALIKCKNDCKIRKIILVPDFCPLKLNLKLLDFLSDFVLNVHCRATRPCCLRGCGNTRILQSFTTGAACSYYQSATNLQKEMQSVRCYDISGTIFNGKTKGFNN